jgi:hypothetical protein
MIMESIQRMALEGSPLVAMPQQGVKPTNNVIIAELLAENQRAEPSAEQLTM